MYNIPQHEFEELKECFDKNDCYTGTTKLAQIINDSIESAFKPDQYGNNYQQPLIACQGVEIASTANSWESPTISIDPDLLESISNMAEQVQKLTNEVENLKAMHSEDSVIHTPKIISTKEQWEEMRPDMDAEERVIVHTTFDKALSVL